MRLFSAHLWRPLVRVGTWLHLAVVLLVWGLLWLAPLEWWPVTLIRFGPRWVCAVPLVALVPVALKLHPRLCWLQLVALGVVLGPIMALWLPWRLLQAAPAAAMHLRILTCNLDGDSLNLSTFNQLIEQLQPDLAALQECSSRDAEGIRWPAGWHVCREPAGLLVASRYPIHYRASLDSRHLGENGEAGRYELDLPSGRVRFLNLHLPTPRKGIEAFLETEFDRGALLREGEAGRWHASDVAWHWVEQGAGPILLAGDLNMPCDCPIYRRYWSRYTDAFATAGIGYGYSKWTTGYGVRIDHILSGPGWRCRHCWVGPDVGSDHLPVIADIEWLDPKASK